MNGTAWIGIMPCDGCSLDTVGNHMTVALDHLTDFALLGNPLDEPIVDRARTEAKFVATQGASKVSRVWIS